MLYFTELNFAIASPFSVPSDWHYPRFAASFASFLQIWFLMVPINGSGVQDRAARTCWRCTSAECQGGIGKTRGGLSVLK